MVHFLLYGAAAITIIIILFVVAAYTILALSTAGIISIVPVLQFIENFLEAVR